jgi:murein DD-endopeptidase MepM/ murein hydrolase activator NlpD
MKFIFAVVAHLSIFSACGQLPDKTIYDLKSGRLKDDTSHIYSLPYEAGRSFLLIQGANSKMSHKNELAYDFKMKKGTKICAARSGVVTDLRSDSDKGGLKPENLSDGNFIILLHPDGSRSYYWHLQKNGVLVEKGSEVKQGEVIGLSGNTGYTAFPHLHFQVTDANGKEILVRFATKNGVAYLRPGKWYRGSAPSK